MLRHDPPPPAKETASLVWLNPTASHDEQRKAARRLIWSRAAIHSHSIAPRTRKSAGKATQQRKGAPCRIKKRDVAQREPAVLTKEVQSRLDIDDNDDVVVVAESSSKHSSALIRPARLPSPLLMDATTRDPFASTPVTPLPWYAWLADFWYNYVVPKSSQRIKVSIPELHAYQIWSRRLELTEPALYYMSLFMATGIPVSQGRLDLRSALFLRSKTVNAINEALNDPERRMSNAVILAIGRIALHEHVYGDRDLAHRVHRPAYKRAIELRGGIEAMGLPRVTVQLMVWCDAFMSAEAHTPMVLTERFKGKEGEEVKMYSADEATSVVKLCSPKRAAHPGYVLPEENREEGNAVTEVEKKG